MKIQISHSLEETEKIATKWLIDLMQYTQGKLVQEGATIIGLSGHLGSGKTAFTQIVGKLLGITEVITSPTFVIMKIYEIGSNDHCSMINLISIKTKDVPKKDDFAGIKVIPWKRMIHIDAYRLENGKELEMLKLEDLITDNKSLILIEWPENVKNALLSKNIQQNINFSSIDESSGQNNREITFN